MTGITCVYITKDNDIYKIPIPNGNLYKPVPALAHKEVLFTLLYYETVNRIPSKLISANFDRIQLDNNGGYEFTIDEIKKRNYNFDNYAFSDAESLSQRDCLPIPQTTIIPTTAEKEALYYYIKEKFPHLWLNFAEILECYIQSCIYNDLELKQLVKKASLLRHNALKKSGN
jgi:hypothetical protein